MTDDLLKRATDALRSETETTNLRSGLTRARVLDAASKRYAGPRRWLLRWLVTLTSLFVVGTAFARFSEEWPALREFVRGLPMFSPPASISGKGRSPTPSRVKAVDQHALRVLPGNVDSARAVAPLEPVVPSSAEVAAPALEPVTTSARSLAADRRGHPGSRHASRPAAARVPVPPPVASTPTPTPAPLPPPTAAAQPRPGSAELALFRRAQGLHLAHDPAAALVAWDAYLHVAGHGVLAPEARYNRALCLVRLGRSAEARAALEPFAQGAWAGYRSAEAKALIDALSH